MSTPKIRSRAAQPRGGIAGAVICAVVTVHASCSVGRTESLGDAIAKAKPGDVISLASGVHQGPIRLPAGVKLKGAGVGKTIIDARSADDGVVVEGGKGAAISDLDVIGAKRANVRIEKAEDITVAKVRAVGGLVGVQLRNCTSARLENLVADHNRYGVTIAGGARNVVVNCTITDNSSLGASIASGENHVVFNNVLTHSPSCFYVGEQAVSPAVDHNYYSGLILGKKGGQSGKRTIDGWRSVSGLDAHSLSGTLGFRNAKEGDFTPATVSAWSLEGAVTSDLGVAEYAGFAAPERDIKGAGRVGLPDAGAYEVAFKPEGPPAGSFTIKDGSRLTSAGVFDAADRLVCFLFQNAPIPAGEHRFWLPANDILGKPIAAGTYALKLTQSDLKWEYLGHVGDNGANSPGSATASVAPRLLAFDDQGRLFMGQGWSEDNTNLRAYRGKDGKLEWWSEGSFDHIGLCVLADGTVLMAKGGDQAAKILAHNPGDGSIVSRKEFNSSSWNSPVNSKGMRISSLQGIVYFCRPNTNEIVAVPLGGSKPERVITTLKSPIDIAADPIKRVLWVVSDEERVACITPQGERVSELPLASPAAVAVRDGRLAAASRATGKVHFFDVKDPAHPREVGTLGKGDGPFGPVLPDRFVFQSPRGNPGRPSHVALALGPEGRTAVVDRNRLLVFDSKGSLLWDTAGVFGNGMVVSHAVPGRLYDGSTTYQLDEKNGAWRAEAVLDDRELAGFTLLGDYHVKGAVYGTFLNPAVPGQIAAIAKLDKYAWRKVALVERHDRQGRPAGLSLPRFNRLGDSGDLFLMGPTEQSWMARIPLVVDSSGRPGYALDRRAELPRPQTLVSPYTHRPEKLNGVYAFVTLADGTGIAEAIIPSSGGTGLANTAGTDLIGCDKAGAPRWVHPYAEHKGIVGLANLGPVTICGVMETSEILAVDRDGLSLTGFAPAPQTHYEGYFLDHQEAVQSYKGADGRRYALIADNFNGRIHWYRLHNEDKIMSSRTRFELSESSRAHPAGKAPAIALEPPVIRIRRLNDDLPIDGDLEKWRKLKIDPVVIVTPESAVGVSGPEDCSALIRMAYKGQSLYVQAIQFDDVVTFHQPVEFHYKQDCLEMCLNGFMTGFKFDISRTTDAGPMIIRQRFFGGKNSDAVLDPKHSPVVVKTLENSADVSERSFIENAYGIDLKNAKAIIYEFRLPIDEITYKPDTKAIIDLKSGAAFRIGFMIDDNDNPGADLQNFIPWPPSFGVFSDKDTGAKAILE